jgi:hypothetical protein
MSVVAAASGAVTVTSTPPGTSLISVVAPVTALGQCAIFPLGASPADEAAGGVEALAGGVLEATTLALGVVPEVALSLQLSQPARRENGRTSSQAVDRTRPPEGRRHRCSPISERKSPCL